MVFKSIHIVLHVLFLNEKVLTLHYVSSGLSYLVNFYLIDLLKKLSNETI